MNLQLIRRLLEIRHSKDLVAHEVKSGPTQGATHARLDTWALARSWVRPMTWGYEIKLTRSDFQRDDKWHRYLPLCRQFYFVCPKDLIQPEEVPGEVGLIWASPKQLRTKRKAATRELDPETENDLFRYLLMSRATIGADSSDPEAAMLERRAYRTNLWRELIAQREDSRKLGERVRGKVRELVRKSEEEVRRAKAELEGCALVSEWIREMGLDPADVYRRSGRFRGAESRREIEAAVLGIPTDSIDELRRSLRGLEKAVEELRARYAPRELAAAEGAG